MLKPIGFFISAFALLCGLMPARAGLIDDINSVIDNEPLPPDRSEIARGAIAVDRCKADTPWKERVEKCSNLTPDQIEHYVQERREEFAKDAAVARRDNAELQRKQYLGCLLKYGVDNNTCDFLAPGPSR